MFFGRKPKRMDARKGRAARIGAAAPKRGPGFRIPAHAVLVGLLFIVATSLVIIAGGQVMPWREGQRPWQEIRVRQPFSVLDQEATERARREAQESTPNYYRLNQSLLGQIERDLTGLYNDLRATELYANLDQDKRQALDTRWGIDEPAFQRLQALLVEGYTFEEFQQDLQQLRAALAATHIIERMPEKYQKVGSVVLMDPATRTGQETRRWTFANRQDEVAELLQRSVAPFPRPMTTPVRRYLADLFKEGAQAVWLFDVDETEKQRQINYNAQEDRYRRYEPGQVLMPPQQMITSRDLAVLEAEHHAYWEALSARTKILANAGIVTLVAVVTLVIGIYSVKWEPRATMNWTRCAALAAIMFIPITLGRVLSLAGLNEYHAVFHVVLVALVMTVAYNQRFSLMITVTLTALLVLAMRGDFGLFLALLTGGVTVTMILDEVRSRSKLIEVAGAAAMMSFAIDWCYQLVTYQQIGYGLINAVWAAAAAFVAVFMFQGILPGIERLFQIATSMTLLEWSDASKPLMRRLALEIPGTFNHCLLIGNMAETAAEAIGANGLLARVGAFYHDIGKLSKPEYFVENQPTRNLTRHKGLSPAMSLLVIIGHVKDGLELAKEYGVPKVLHQFITEHHGTTLVEYFYRLANQQRSEAGQEPVSDIEFRYPGPKPHSRESAILMLADAAEGSTRALSEPTVGSIENQVHQIVKRRLEDGQLDDCELTLRELHQVEDSLTRSLWAMYHGRIKYPSQDADRDREEKKEPRPEPRETAS